MTAPQIITITAKKLIGKSLTMSISADRTAELWRSFMPERAYITHAVGSDLYSLQMYNVEGFSNFTPQTVFTKWALVDVSAVSDVPEGMEVFMLEGGLYAVFHYVGRPQDFAPVFQYIFGEWLPESGYEVDSRPHFELLGGKYRNNDPESEEDIYIPVRHKE